MFSFHTLIFTFSLKRTTQVHQQTDTPILRFYTRRQIDPLVMVEEAGRHAMQAVDKSRTEGVIEIPTVVSDPPRSGVVKVTEN